MISKLDVSKLSQYVSELDLSETTGYHQGGSGGMLPPRKFKKNTHKHVSSVSWSQVSVSQARLEFTQIPLKSKISN